MKAKDLIAILDTLDPDAEVYRDEDQSGVALILNVAVGHTRHYDRRTRTMIEEDLIVLQ